MGIRQWLKDRAARPETLKALIKQGYTAEQADDVIDTWAFERKLAKKHSARRKRRS